MAAITAPPSMADAKKAARAVASEEVSEVLVFGSVARGEAGPDSDIDLVAVYDDLDYSTRWERSTELGRLASAAAGRRVFVYVTDWPEWTRRAAEVSSSLERAVAGYAVALHRRPPNGVSWGKEIGMPATDREEAAARLDNARRALFGVATHLPMGPEERYALTDGDTGYYVFGMRDRLCALCADARMAMETSLKALIHLGGIRPARTHDLGRARVQAGKGPPSSKRTHRSTAAAGVGCVRPDGPDLRCLQKKWRFTQSILNYANFCYIELYGCVRTPIAPRRR